MNEGRDYYPLPNLHKTAGRFGLMLKLLLALTACASGDPTSESRSKGGYNKRPNMLPKLL